MRFSMQVLGAVLLLTVCSLVGAAAAGEMTHLWSKRFGDSAYQLGQSVTTDPWGNMVVTGYFDGTVDFGGGPLTSAGSYDIFVAKFDAGGNHLWSKRFGDSSEQGALSVDTDASGNVVVAGLFRGGVDLGGSMLTSAGNYDIFVAKFDSSGNHLWSRGFGDWADQVAPSVTTDPSGNVVVTGYFQSSIDFGGGPLTSAGYYDVFVAKFDSSGNHLWSKRFGGSLGDQFAQSVATDPSGNVVVTGYFDGTVDFGGGPLTSAGSYDIFVAKFDAGGNHLWSERFGDSVYQLGQSVATDPSGNVVVTGCFYGSVDFGGGPLTSAGYSDIFVAKFDSSGNHLWSKRFGDSSEQGACFVATDASGNVVITGYFFGSVDFGGGPLTSAGGWDIFVVKFGFPLTPHILSIRDMPSDQGGWVRTRFARSSRDDAGEVSYPISTYGIWRRVDNPDLIASLGAQSSHMSYESPRSDAPDLSGLPVVTYGGMAYLQSRPGLFESSFPAGTWELVLSVPAVQQETYVAAVPTVADSTVSGAYYTVLVVTAHTTTPSIWYASAPDSGCSVDNIAPGVPTGFAVAYNTGSGNHLSWDASAANDFQYFRVYRSTDPDFVPSRAELVDATSGTSWSDPEYDGWNVYYKITALDHAGNESNPASAGTTTGIDEPASPKWFALYQNVPNPFNPATVIHYDVPEGGGRMTLSVYDVSGQLVRTLADGVETPGEKRVSWDGTNANGEQVTTGVYFYRLTAGDKILAKKMVLLK